jgi:hypothetical protein
MEFHDLLMALPPAGQGDFLPHYCGHCDLRYETAWFIHQYRHTTEGHCFFCHRFRTPRITRFALLRETEWFFLQSGEDDARAFYEAYFFYLHRWADRFGVNHTQEEMDYQEGLLRGLLDSAMEDR